LLFNIHTLTWDEELLSIFSIPRKLLPDVRASSEILGATQTPLLNSSIPIAGVAGDQQAALFGQLCTEVGMAKNTYGTGCFLLMNTGNSPVMSQRQLITTIAWKIKDEVCYCLEGSIFIGGAIVQWLRDALGIVKRASDIERLATSVADSNGVVIVPAFSGLGAPHWNPYARGSIFGVTRGATAAHFARAALEAIAFQSYDVLKAMEADLGQRIAELRVDGGAANNNFLMQFQADLLDATVIRPTITETTALGAAYLAGLAVGFWQSIDELKTQWREDRRFSASINQEVRDQALERWSRAVNGCVAWANA
jgi:glycerol kinase